MQPPQLSQMLPPARGARRAAAASAAADALQHAQTPQAARSAAHAALALLAEPAATPVPSQIAVAHDALAQGDHVSAPSAASLALRGLAAASLLRVRRYTLAADILAAFPFRQPLPPATIATNITTHPSTSTTVPSPAIAAAAIATPVACASASAASPTLRELVAADCVPTAISPQIATPTSKPAVRPFVPGLSSLDPLFDATHGAQSISTTSADSPRTEVAPWLLRGLPIPTSPSTPTIAITTLPDAGSSTASLPAMASLALEPTSTPSSETTPLAPNSTTTATVPIATPLFPDRSITIYDQLRIHIHVALLHLHALLEDATEQNNTSNGTNNSKVSGSNGNNDNDDEFASYKLATGQSSLGTAVSRAALICPEVGLSLLAGSESVFRAIWGNLQAVATNSGYPQLDLYLDRNLVMKHAILIHLLFKVSQVMSIIAGDLQAAIKRHSDTGSRVNASLTSKSKSSPSNSTFLVAAYKFYELRQFLSTSSRLLTSLGTSDMTDILSSLPPIAEVIVRDNNAVALNFLLASGVFTVLSPSGFRKSALLGMLVQDRYFEDVLRDSDSTKSEQSYWRSSEQVEAMMDTDDQDSMDHAGMKKKRKTTGSHERIIRNIPVREALRSLGLFVDRLYLGKIVSTYDVSSFQQAISDCQTLPLENFAAEHIPLLPLLLKNCVSSAVAEHNLLCATMFYKSIRFSRLREILLEDDTVKCQLLAGKMIREGRITGRIDQIEQIVYFTDKCPAPYMVVSSTVTNSVYGDNTIENDTLIGTEVAANAAAAMSSSLGEDTGMVTTFSVRDDDNKKNNINVEDTDYEEDGYEAAFIAMMEPAYDSLGVQDNTTGDVGGGGSGNGGGGGHSGGTRRMTGVSGTPMLKQLSIPNSGSSNGRSVMDTEGEIGSRGIIGTRNIGVNHSKALSGLHLQDSNDMVLAQVCMELDEICDIIVERYPDWAKSYYDGQKDSL